MYVSYMLLNSTHFNLTETIGFGCAVCTYYNVHTIVYIYVQLIWILCFWMVWYSWIYFSHCIQVWKYWSTFQVNFIFALSADMVISKRNKQPADAHIQIGWQFKTKANHHFVRTQWKTKTIKERAENLNEQHLVCFTFCGIHNLHSAISKCQFKWFSFVTS